MKAGDASLIAAARLANIAFGVGLAPRLSILIFHRVLPQADPLFPREIDATRFDRMMAAVSKVYDVMSLTQAVTRLSSGQLRGRPLVITFDDGYADNEEVALPILRRHGLTANFFVATGFLDGGRMWNDSVIECLRRTTVSQLDLRDFGLGALTVQTLGQRRSAIERVIPFIKYLGLHEREAALAALLDAAGRPSLPRTLMLRRDQVYALHRAGMEIGAHTVHHPILTTLPDDQARHELSQGRSELEHILGGAPVRTLAFPNGGPDRDYDARHVAFAQELGFEAAVTTAVGVAGPGDDIFQLPRFTPWDASLPRWLFRLAANQRNTRFKRATALPTALQK